MAFLTRMNADLESAAVWSRKAVTVAESVGDRRRDRMDGRWSGDPRDHVRDRPPRSRSTSIAQIIARREGRTRELVDVLDALVLCATRPPRLHAVTRGTSRRASRSAAECGHELAHLYFLAHRAQIELRGAALGRSGRGRARSCSANATSRRFRGPSRWSCSPSFVRAAATPTCGRCSTEHVSSRSPPASSRESRPSPWHEPRRPGWRGEARPSRTRPTSPSGSRCRAPPRGCSASSR